MSEYKGEISLHDGHSIGLVQPLGSIKLYPDELDTYQRGIRINVDLRHYRKAGSTNGFMTLDWIELHIPGLCPYRSHIEGWEPYITYGSITVWRPKTSNLYPFTDDNITFRLLDYMSEPDPYFYAGWTLRTDNMPPSGYRSRMCVAYLGVNFPLIDVPPEFTEVPSHDVLLDLLKDSIYSGEWHLKAGISPFIVDSEVTMDSWITLRAMEGWRRAYHGALDFVHPNAGIVGKHGVDWSNANWGSTLDPGILRMVSGDAAGYKFKVIGKQYSGETPPPDYPLHCWLILLDPAGPVPSAVGVKAGDEFLLTGPYLYQAWPLAEIKEIMLPGAYMAKEFDLPFEPFV